MLIPVNDFISEVTVYETRSEGIIVKLRLAGYTLIHDPTVVNWTARARWLADRMPEDHYTFVGTYVVFTDPTLATMYVLSFSL